MRKVLAVLFGILAVAAGLYVGGYLMFIGGIIQGVEAVKEDPVDAAGIAWGVARVVFAGLAGWLTAFLVGFVSFSLWDSGDRNRRRQIRNRRGVV